MKNNTKLSSASPNHLQLDPTYWINHEKPFLGLLVINTIIFRLLFNFSFPKFNDPLILVSLIIYGFALWGIWIIMQSLIKLNIETAIATRISENLGEILRKVKSKEVDKIDLDKITEYFPSTSNAFKSSVIRLANYITNEAKDRKFDSCDLIMRPYKEEAIGDLFKITGIQKMVLWLGILGTFLGLIIAFTNLGDISEIDKNFSKITDALQYSFGTSVAGLEASAMLSLFIMLLNRRQDNYFKILEDATQTTISLARKSTNNDGFLAGFDQMAESIREVKDSVYDQQAETRAQTKVIQSGISKLKVVKEDFDLLLFNMTDEMKRVYDIFSPEKISEELKSNLENAVSSISETLDTNITHHLKRYNQIRESMTKVSNSLEHMERQLNGQIAFNNESLTKVKEEVYTAVTNLSNMQYHYLAQINEREPNQQFEQMVQNIETRWSEQFSNKTQHALTVLNSLDQSLNRHSRIIESQESNVSYGKLVFVSMISIICTFFLSLLFLWVLQQTAPTFLTDLTKIVKLIIGR